MNNAFGTCVFNPRYYPRIIADVIRYIIKYIKMNK